MDTIPNQTIPFISRPSEYERLVADLIDQRFFGPAAITTSLNGVRGMGKTSLAKEICRDPRVVSTYPDGIYWVTLGQTLSPLQILSRIEHLVYDLSGEQPGLVDFKAAELHLRELVLPRRLLLVLDEAGDEETIRPFLQTGPGGGVLIITRSDENLPLGVRRTPVDIMDSQEAVALLSWGLIDLFGEAKAGLPEPGSTPTELPSDLAPEHKDEDESSGMDGTAGSNHTNTLEHEGQQAGLSNLEDIFTDPLLEGLAPQEPSAGIGEENSLPSLPSEKVEPKNGTVLPAEDSAMLVELAGRLNEWPIMLSLANGFLHGCLSDQQPETFSLGSAMNSFLINMVKNGLDEDWAINDERQREKAFTALLATCLEPLPVEIVQRFLDLVIFPVDEDIPLAAVSSLWHTTPQETILTAERLSARGLLMLDLQAWTLRMHSIMQELIADQLRAGVSVDLHTTIVKGYAARCKQDPIVHGVKGWANGPDDGYYYQHLGQHMVAAGMRTELQKLLFHFGWLYRYLTCTNLLTGRRGDLYSLLLDFEITLSTALDRQSAELRLIEEALRLSAPILIHDPGQLAAQLLGRLLPFEEPDIQNLLREAECWTDEPWMRPISACFSLPGGNEVRTMTGHTDWVTGLAMLPDGQHALSGSLDGSLRWWDLANGHNLRTIQAHAAGISTLVVTPDGRRVVTGGWEGKVRVWDTGSGELLFEFEAHPDAVGAVAVTPDGLHLISGGDDRIVRVWNLTGGSLVKELVGHGDPVRSLAISPDGRQVLSGSWDCTVRSWDLETGTQVHFLTGHEGWISALAFSPDGSCAFSTGWDRTIRVWDMANGEVLQTITGFNRPILSLTLAEGGKVIIAGGGDGALNLIDVTTGDILRTLSGHSGGINQIVITNEGRFAVTAADDRTLRVWDLVALKAKRPQLGHEAPVFAMQTLPGTKQGITASWDGTLKIWDLATGVQEKILAGHEGGVITLAVSNDGHMAVSGSRDHTLKVWDIASGTEIRTLAGHAGAITALSLTADGRFAVSGADDGTMKVWDIESGACLSEFRGESSIWSCALAEDGRTVVASESSGRLYFLEIMLPTGGPEL